MKVSTVSEMRNCDQTAIEKFGIKDELLMENAGLAAFSVLRQEVGVTNKKFIVFCGGGNNGGDGFVIARKIHSHGGTVKIFILGDPGKFKGSAKLNLDIVTRIPVPVTQLESLDSVKKEVSHCDGIIDAIFGTGLYRDVKGLYRAIIELINVSNKPVLCVDIPSGIHGDSAKIMGVAVKGDYTVTFGLPKVGNLLYPGYEHCGKLYVTHISFPQSIYNDDTMKIEINSPLKLPARKKEGHKGTFGVALFIAGAANYYGAPYFAALSFLKAGGGYSYLAAPASVTPFIAQKGSEIVYAPQKETENGSLARTSKSDILQLAGKSNIVILGPGLSLHEETQQLAREIAAGVEKPLLIDGDGITALCRDLDIIKHRSHPTILTPHLGEMSSITSQGIPEIDTKKITILQQTARDLNAMIVLKGAHSLIGYPDGRIFINLSGNSGMASAGSGDVLTGTIAAMFGLGLPIAEATRKGVFMHGLAGDLGAEACGEDGLTAQTILDYLPQALMLDREGLPEHLLHRYQGVSLI
ncbi:NAD(P)H-hydrate dehydratase [candidate division CSSED10-310 bacterium]|uniref:Bifunctional NAD(P)H-hydrate repair enzyme n=1 Tax=candidate division CSSED10-310 bacterium TaxID=2855610 RepID=A0ABV6YRN9_UNCC1